MAETLRRPHDYTGPRDPHVLLSAEVDDAGEKSWRCLDCGATGTWDGLDVGGCTAEHTNCEVCGCGPVCDLHCAGFCAARPD